MGGREASHLPVPTAWRRYWVTVAQVVPDPFSELVSLPVRLAPPPLPDRLVPCVAVPVAVVHAEVVPGELVVTVPELVPPALALPVVDPLTVVPPLGVDTVADVPLGVDAVDVKVVLVLPGVAPVVVDVLAELPLAPALPPAEVVPPPLLAPAVTVAGPLTLAPAFALPLDGVTAALAPPADALAPFVAAEASAEPFALVSSFTVTVVFEPSVLAFHESVVLADADPVPDALVPPVTALAVSDADAPLETAPDVLTAATATEANASAPIAANAAEEKIRDTRMLRPPFRFPCSTDLCCRTDRSSAFTSFARAWVAQRAARSASSGASEAVYGQVRSYAAPVPVDL